MRRLPRTLGLCWTLSLALAAAAFLALRHAAGLRPLWAYLGGVNAAALAVLAYDKAIARTSAVRVPETLLHALALAGGSAAVLLGAQLFRHKTRKRGFQVVLIAILAAQAAFGAFWLARR